MPVTIVLSRTSCFKRIVLTANVPESDLGHTSMCPLSSLIQALDLRKLIRTEIQSLQDWSVLIVTILNWSCNPHAMVDSN